MKRFLPIPLLVLIALAFIIPNFNPKWPPGGDPNGYFVYLPALWAGHPFDYSALQPYPWLKHNPITGLTQNEFGIGPALFWLLPYSAIHLLHPELPLMAQPFWSACA